MSGRHEIAVSRSAVLQGRNCGLRGDVEARVRGLAAAAMPSNHPSGNRAYGPFVLYVRGTQVMSITMIGPQPLDDRPVASCKLCSGMMIRRHRVMLEGKEGVASRPCPRAFDATQPVCDTLTQDTTYSGDQI